MGLCEISSVYFLVDLICGLFLSLAATIGRHTDPVGLESFQLFVLMVIYMYIGGPGCVVFLSCSYK